MIEAAETTCWASGGVSSDMASSNIDQGPEQDWPDLYIARPVKVSNEDNNNILSKIAQIFAIFGKRKQSKRDDHCGTGRSRRLRFVSTPTTTPLTRSSGDKGTSSAEREDPPGIECQEQENTDGRTYETDVWHHSSRSRRVSFTVSRVQRSCHYSISVRAKSHPPVIIQKNF